MDTNLGIEQVFKIIHDAVAKGAWWPLAGLALVFVVSAMRKLAVRRMGKVGAWLATDHGAMLLTVATAVLGGLGVSLLGGAPPSKATIVGALMVGATALVAFPTVRKFIKSWFGVDLGLAEEVKTASVAVAPSGRQTVSASAPAPPPTPPPAPPEPPPPPREGGSITVGALLFLSVLAFFLACFLSGCACTPASGKVDSYTCARQVVLGVDTVDGAVARIAKSAAHSCREEAQKLKESKPEEALEKYNQCTTLSETSAKVVVGTSDALQAASDSIDVAEKAKTGPETYADKVSGAVTLARDMARLLLAQGVPIPPYVLLILGVK